MNIEETKDSKAEDKNVQQKNETNQMITGLSVVWNLIYVIAVPIVLFTLLGKYLDQRFHKDFLFVLIGGAIGIATGIYGVYRKAGELKEKIYGQEDDKDKKI